MQINCILSHFPCLLKNAHISVKMHTFSHKQGKCMHFTKSKVSDSMSSSSKVFLLIDQAEKYPGG